MEQLFEKFLWNTRLVLLIGVICCVITAGVLILMGCFELYHLIAHLLTYLMSHGHEGSRDGLVLSVIEILDTFLLSSVLFIFSFGLYELFISSIERSSGPESSVFRITSIDELKAKLGKVIVMIMVIKLFSFLVEVSPKTTLEILYMAVIVLLISVSLWLGHKNH